MLSKPNWFGGGHVVHRKGREIHFSVLNHIVGYRIVVVKCILTEHSLADLIDTKSVLTRAGSRYDTVFAKKKISSNKQTE